jgi:hypothetical protein
MVTAELMMIEFRCWYCNRKHTMPQKGIGKTIRCSCSSELRVPRHSGGKCRVKTLADWAVEALVYGGGGALLRLGLALLILAGLLRFLFIQSTTGAWIVLLPLPLLGFLLGLLGGERAINWIGRIIHGVKGSDY